MTGKPSGAPILLVGAQRSGTTALGHALAQAIANAGGCFTVNGKLPYYLKRWWQDDPATRHARADEVSYALRRRKPGGPSADEWLVRTEEALIRSSERIAQNGNLDLKSEMRRVCHEAYGKLLLWGDKYNEYLLDLDFLDELFPSAVWLFVGRHPAEVVDSMLRWTGTRPWNPVDVDAAAEKWAYWNEQWLYFRDRIPSDRRIELDYHNLGQSHRKTLDDVLGLTMEPYLVHYRPRMRAEAHAVILPVNAHRTWSRMLDLGIVAS
jgi:hypothetical protein